MSFILEALRKSENERQRQSGPDFASIPDAAERRSPSRWPALVGILVLFNLALLAIVFWPEAEHAGPEPVTRTARTPAAPAPEPAPKRDPAMAQPPVVKPASAAPAPATRPAATVPLAARQGEATPSRDVRSLSEEVTPREDLPAPAGEQPAATDPGTAVVADQPTTDERVTQAAVAPPSATTPSAATGSQDPAPASPARKREDLPTANELRLQGFLTGPPLHLDLHVYYPEPSRRVVFISGARYREGDRINGGAVVREIVPDGVVLEDRGRRFLLGPD